MHLEMSKQTQEPLWKLGKKFRIDEKELDAAEAEVYAARHEHFPIGPSRWDSLMWNCACHGWRRRATR
jgi:hypothetical protein